MNDYEEFNSDQLTIETGPRQRMLTEKGREEKLSRLKNNQTSALSAISRKRSKITELMSDKENVHLVKTELSEVDELLRHFRNAHVDYHHELSSVEDKEKQNKYFALREDPILEFRQQVSQ
jgi:predicted patatin/cPLA2 family phospholipase